MHDDAKRHHAIEVARIATLVENESYAAAIETLERAATHDVDLLMDSMGIAERGALAARPRYPAHALALLRFAHQANVVWASMSTSGAEGHQRMLDVNRLAAQIRAWEADGDG